MNTDSSGASYCTLKLFHDKLNPDMPVSKGHISKDGHHFDCVHSESYHTPTAKKLMDRFVEVAESIIIREDQPILIRRQNQ